jgi:hypothetical protein
MLTRSANVDAIIPYNKMHAWLKVGWNEILEDSNANGEGWCNILISQNQNIIVFIVFALLMNFLHKCFTFEVIGKHVNDLVKHDWDGDY